MRAAGKAPVWTGAAAPATTAGGRTAWSLPDAGDDDERTLSRVVRPPTPQAIAPVKEAPAPNAIRADEESVAGRLADLARAALLGGDAGALERWSEGLKATGEHERFAERMDGMAHLSRGQIGDALRILKKARETADDGTRAQASLALGVALAAAGRPEEALLEALDALARAREKLDDKGASACLAFLAKLFQTQQKTADAELLRSAAHAPAPARART
jgi:tetratricopeptide (TPR) repeat protein